MGLLTLERLHCDRSELERSEQLAALEAASIKIEMQQRPERLKMALMFRRSRRVPAIIGTSLFFLVQLFLVVYSISIIPIPFPFTFRSVVARAKKQRSSQLSCYGAVVYNNENIVRIKWLTFSNWLTLSPTSLRLLTGSKTESMRGCFCCDGVFCGVFLIRFRFCKLFSGIYYYSENSSPESW